MSAYPTILAGFGGAVIVSVLKYVGAAAFGWIVIGALVAGAVGRARL